MSSPTGYSRLQISLHWIVTILVVLQFVLHNGISGAWDGYLKGQTVAFSPVVASHVLFGGAIFLFMVWRLVLRFKRGVPALPAEESYLQKLIAKAVHFLLIAVLLLMPISGSAAWFGGVEQAANGHEVMKVVLMALVALHVLGALVNQFVLKNGLIKRMMKAA